MIRPMESAPSLSQQIRQLEKELGVTLLERNRHRVAVTNAGRVFLQQARDILARVDHASRLARQAAGGSARFRRRTSASCHRFGR